MADNIIRFKPMGSTVNNFQSYSYMTHDIDIDDSDIEALVDGELSSEDARELRSAIIRSPYHLKKYEALMRQKSLLQLWWKSSYKEN